MASTRWTARFERASELLASVRDVVIERPFAAAPPSWCEERGWTAYLGPLSDGAVDVAERDGLATWVASDGSAPRDLVDLATHVAEVCSFEAHRGDRADRVDARHVPKRKRAQVATFTAAVRALGVHPARIVDVGSGHGHLTRHLAEEFDVMAEGLEVNDALVARAASLARGTKAAFHRVDVRSDRFEVAPNDLVVGLHCCGDLGDRAVIAARDAGAAVAVMGCCPQKRDGERVSLTETARVDRARLTLPHAALGLANRHEGDAGIEVDLATRIRSRVFRLALHQLFHDAGLALEPGEEMRGVNRRHATHSLDALVEKAFAVRDVGAPSAVSIRTAENDAWTRFARMRRWSLARDMLARLVEVWIALDRAAVLEAAGHVCNVSIAFDAEISPRNVLITGVRDR